jgi:hypothetical protein
VERFVAVQYPLQRPHVCTVARAKTAVVALALLALVLNAYILVAAGVERNYDGTDTCDMREEYGEVMRIITVADSLLTLAIPSVLIFVMNAMITRNLIRFNHRFQVCNETWLYKNFELNCPHVETVAPFNQGGLHSVRVFNSRSFVRRD